MVSGPDAGWQHRVGWRLRVEGLRVVETFRGRRALGLVPTVAACARRAFRGTRIVARRNALSGSSSSTTPSGPARPFRLARVPRPGMTNTDVGLGTHPGDRTRIRSALSSASSEHGPKRPAFRNDHFFVLPDRLRPSRAVPRRRMRPGDGRGPTRRHQATAGRAAARRQQYGIGSWAASMRRPTRRRCCRRRRRLPAGKLRMRTSKESVSQPREALATPMPSAGVRLPGRQMGDLIHQVHVVEALDAVQVALMDGIDPHPARLSERLRAAAVPDRDLHRARRQRRRSAAPLIACRVPQVVQMAVGDAGQAFEAAVAEQMESAGAELARGRTGQRAVEHVELGQQPDVGVGVAARERSARGVAAVGDLSRGPVLLQQACDLGP